MGLLDKLWDDTVAGPRPDTGLSRLRKPSSPVTPRPNAVKDASEAAEAAPRVTRSIMIKRPAGALAPAGCPSPTGSGTPPPSPAGSTPPLSPFAGGGGRFRRKSLSDAYERGGGFGPKSPTPPFEV